MGSANLVVVATLVMAYALLTVLLSVFAHGITALPLVSRYSAWYQAHETKPSMESLHVNEPRWRGQPQVRDGKAR